MDRFSEPFLFWRIVGKEDYPIYLLDVSDSILFVVSCIVCNDGDVKSFFLVCIGMKQIHLVFMLSIHDTWFILLYSIFS